MVRDQACFISNHELNLDTQNTNGSSFLGMIDFHIEAKWLISADKRRYNDVIMTPKRRRDVVLTS